MARQKSIIKLKGTLGGITFYQTKDGYIAKEKSEVSSDRIKNDPAYQRTRENGYEFGRAGKSGKVLRNSIRSLLQNASDSRMVSRLTQIMVKVIQMDQVNPRGQRNVIDGEATLLEGFEFNINGKLGTTLYAPKTYQIDRSSGLCEVNLPGFAPDIMVGAPGGTTHFKIVSAASAVDFENEAFVSEMNESAIMPWDSTVTSDMVLSHEVGANSPHPIFLFVGIEFYQDVNGEKYPLKNGSYNALSIVKVDSPV